MGKELPVSEAAYVFRIDYPEGVLFAALLPLYAVRFLETYTASAEYSINMKIEPQTKVWNIMQKLKERQNVDAIENYALVAYADVRRLLCATSLF